MAACCDAGSGTQVMGDGCGAALGHSVMLQCCLCTVTFLYFQLLPKIMKYKTLVTTALFIEQSFEGVDFLFLIFFSFSLPTAYERLSVAGRCDCEVLINLRRRCLDE